MKTNNGNGAVAASKDFPVSADILYRAWTEPDQLKRWWKPMGNQLTDVSAELKEGGEVEYKFKSDGSKDLIIRGKYLEVVPNEKLVYTWRWQAPDEALDDSEYKLSINFQSSGEGSRIDISQEAVNSRESIKPHQHGWEEALNHLSDFLSSDRSGADRESTNGSGEPSGVPDYGS
mgnify:CR=1 FL=1